jgi:translation initiation factor 2 alpha subunit (eIF-2alpha)
MKSSVLSALLIISFASRAQEFEDSHYLDPMFFESAREASSQKNNTSDQFKYVQAQIKAALVEAARSQFVAKSMENVARRVSVPDTSLINDISQILVAQFGYEFLSRAFVFLISGVDVTQVSQLTALQIINTLLQTQTEKAIATVFPHITTGFLFRAGENLIRADIASRLIRLTKTTVLPALKRSVIKTTRAAIAAQKEDEKLMQRIFKEALPKVKRTKYLNGTYAELSYERSPRPIHLRLPQKSTRAKL